MLELGRSIIARWKEGDILFQSSKFFARIVPQVKIKPNGFFVDRWVPWEQWQVETQVVLAIKIT